MPKAKEGIHAVRISDTPFAVVDFETTGLQAGWDRVIEVSVVRLEPGCRPTVVLDTLVNPLRSVAATEIHGITDRDVKDAPTFPEIAGDFVRSISGCMVCAFNVYFDIGFLQYELGASGVNAAPPHVCAMYLRPLLGLGKRCSLQKACSQHGVAYEAEHFASHDALAAAELLRMYLEHMGKKNVETFGDLARLGSYKFIRSFETPFLSPSLVEKMPKCDTLKSRLGFEPRSATPDASFVAASEAEKRRPLGTYWEALKAAMADLEITEEEVRDLERLKEELLLPKEEVRVLHARLFGDVISRFAEDKWLDDKECRTLSRVYKCLSALGWAPGEL